MDAETELESFRKEWRDEVSNRQKSRRRLSAGDLIRMISPASREAEQNRAPPPSTAASNHDVSQANDETETITSYDLNQVEDDYSLATQQYKPCIESAEPATALDHYERAMEKEDAGSLGDSVSLYRKAYRVSVTLKTRSAL